MRSREDIISDAEIERVHGNAQFGDCPKRRVVDEGVLQYALGYSTGHTMLCILLEHHLVRKPEPGSYGTTLTKKGFRYLHAMHGGVPLAKILDLFEGAATQSPKQNWRGV